LPEEYAVFKIQRSLVKLLACWQWEIHASLVWLLLLGRLHLFVICIAPPCATLSPRVVDDNKL
jgi:hypothetical protein